MESQHHNDRDHGCRNIVAHQHFDSKTRSYRAWNTIQKFPMQLICHQRNTELLCYSSSPILYGLACSNRIVSAVANLSFCSNHRVQLPLFTPSIQSGFRRLKVGSGIILRKAIEEFGKPSKYTLPSTSIICHDETLLYTPALKKDLGVHSLQTLPKWCKWFGLRVWSTACVPSIEMVFSDDLLLHSL